MKKSVKFLATLLSVFTLTANAAACDLNELSGLLDGADIDITINAPNGENPSESPNETPSGENQTNPDTPTPENPNEPEQEQPNPYEEYFVYTLNEDGKSYSVGFFTEEETLSYEEEYNKDLEKISALPEEDWPEEIKNISAKYPNGVSVSMFSDEDFSIFMDCVASFISHPLRKSRDVLTIPSSYKGLPVTKIAPYAFSFCWFSGYIIPDTVTEIGDGAFARCLGFRTIKLPAALTKIGGYAFTTTMLTDITIPASVNYIGVQAFAYIHLTATFENPEGWIKHGAVGDTTVEAISNPSEYISCTGHYLTRN